MGCSRPLLAINTHPLALWLEPWPARLESYATNSALIDINYVWIIRINRNDKNETRNRQSCALRSRTRKDFTLVHGSGEKYKRNWLGGRQKLEWNMNILWTNCDFKWFFAFFCRKNKHINRKASRRSHWCWNSITLFIARSARRTYFVVGGRPHFRANAIFHWQFSGTTWSETEQHQQNLWTLQKYPNFRMR